LIGDPGLAKSILLRQSTKLVPNSRFESLQNATGKSLTVIESKEGGENTVLRLVDPELENRGSDDTNDSNGIIRSSTSQQQIERDRFFCKYYTILNNGNVTFTSSDLYIRHVVKSHKGWTAYPGSADIQKFEREFREKTIRSIKSKVAEISKANESGNRIMFGSKEGVNLG
jgi:hypothetical protein